MAMSIMGDDEPLDFEKEDLLLTPSRPSSKRRKVIGLDDLLKDYYNEQSKLVQSKSKKSMLSREYNSEDEDDHTRKLSEVVKDVVDDCQKQVREIHREDEIPLWGQTMFGNQKAPPATFLGQPNCGFIQSLAMDKLNSVLELDAGQGESFLEGLLINGWLLKLSLICGSVEESIASWTFHKLLYSSNEELQVSACDFWCRALLLKNEDDQPVVGLGWFPTHSQLNEALQIYGYLFDTSHDCSSVSNAVHEGSEGPPTNIISWVKVLSACCQIRSIRSMFSTSEVEDFLVVIIRLSLDRQLQGMSFILHECLQSVIGFFSQSEWDSSCLKVSRRVVYRLPIDFNCIRIVESISGESNRSKSLRSQVALQMLIVCCDKKVNDGEGVIKFLSSINVKDKDCDFFKLYINLILVWNWLLSRRSVDEDDPILSLWYKYLRNCSSQITSGDWRPYATKVRNKASYLLQNGVKRRNGE